MCPGGTVVAATSEAGACRHQRHEPVFAQRAQCQRRHRRRHRPAGLPPGRQARRQRGEPAGRRGLPALLGIARLRAGRRRLRGAGPARRRLPEAPALQRLRQRRALVQARRAAHRPGPTRTRKPARLRARRHPRGAARLRAADPRLRAARRAAHRRGDAHLVAAAHPARRRSAERQRRRAVPGRRRRGLCRRHHVGRRRRHRDGRGAGSAAARRLAISLPSSPRA